MKSAKILVFPATRWQVPLIRRLKKEGHTVLAVHPDIGADALSETDGYLISDIFDLDRITLYCRAEKVDAIVSDECDIAVPVVASLGQRLGLPAVSPQTANQFTNKRQMRKFCEESGYPYPEYTVCQTLKEAEAFYKAFPADLIMKPLDSNSSRGVFSISSIEDIRQYFNRSSSFSIAQKGVLLERYISGREYTVDGIKTPDKHYSLAVSEKKHFIHNHNIASELLFTHSNNRVSYQELRNINDRLIENAGLEFGLTHAEYKYENGKFYLIEMAARGGGNLISAIIVPFLSGADNYKYLIDCALGKAEHKPFVIEDCYRSRCAVLKFFETQQAGVVKKIRGYEYLRQEPDIKSFHFNFKAGDYISEAENDSERGGYYIACCPDLNRLTDIMNCVQSRVSIQTV